MIKLRRAEADNTSDNIGWLHNQRRHLITAIGLLSIAIIFLSIFSSFALSRFEIAAEEEEKAAKSFWLIVDHTRKAEIHFRIQIQEWKNTLLRGHNSKAYDKYYLAFNKQAQQVNRDLKVIEQSAANIGLAKQVVTDVLQKHSKLTNNYLDAIKAYNPDNVMSFREVDESVRGKDRPFNQSFTELNIMIYELAETKRNESHENLIDKSRTIKFAIAISSVISIILAGFTLFFSLRIISVR